MFLDFSFLLNSVLLGIGLAMDAFSVSMANGLNEPYMKSGRMCLMSGLYAFFQFAMPLIGWICVHTVVVYFCSFEKFVPWIALFLLLNIGGKMLYEGVKGDEDSCEDSKKLGFGTLIVQAVATSIDALSVGFTISEYDVCKALFASLIIALVTFAVCISGVVIGKRAGTKLSGKASIFGGLILIGIGIEIFVKGIFF